MQDCLQGKFDASRSGKQSNLAVKPGDPAGLLIPCQDQIDFRLGIGSGKDQGIWHSQGLQMRTELSCPLRNSHLHRQNIRDQPGKEPAHLIFVVMPEVGAGQNLGIGDDRNQKAVAVGQVSYRAVGSFVETIIAVEETDYGIRVKDYRHSSRSPSTRSRRSPPV